MSLIFSGGTASGGGGGGAVTIVDGGDVTLGAIADAAVTGDNSGTISAKIRGLNKWAYERMPASLGQKTLALSFPVVLASDQSNINVLSIGHTDPDNVTTPTGQLVQNPVGFIGYSGAPPGISDGRIGMAAMSANRAIQVNLRTNGGSEAGISGQALVTVFGDPISVSGSIIAVTGAVATNNTRFGTANMAIVIVSNTWVGTLQFEANIAGAGWNTVAATDLNTGARITTITANGVYAMPTSAQIRLIATAWTSGTADVTLTTSENAVGEWHTVIGPLTDTQLRATAVPVSAVSLPLPTGAATEASLATRLSESDFDTKIGALTEAAPATDTASSGLNGRLQRIAQRVTSLIALFPAALVGGRFDTNIGAWLGSTAPTVGSKTSANSIPVVVASDQSAVPISGTVTTTPPSNASTNVTQFGSNAVVTGTGVSGLGIPRVTVSSDSSITANAGTNLNTSLLALASTQTDGTQKSIVRGGAKGITTAADVTSTAQSVDRQGLDVQIRTSAGVAVDTFSSADVATDGVTADPYSVGCGPSAALDGQRHALPAPGLCQRGRVPHVLGRQQIGRAHV